MACAVMVAVEDLLVNRQGGIRHFDNNGVWLRGVWKLSAHSPRGMSTRINGISSSNDGFSFQSP
jgi:hypothetical protein